MNRRWFLAIAVLLPLLTVSAAKDDDVTVRWDIVHFTTFSPPTFTAGGLASAVANDGSSITLSGSGTFRPGEGDEVTGGGTWVTKTSGGATTGSGIYRVTELIKFDVAPGTIVGTPVVDLIGPAANAHSGLVLLRIRYSDGSRGVLAVSCDLPVGTPPAIFEGVTASKGFVDYWMRVPPTDGVDGNRTVFHITVRED